MPFDRRILSDTDLSIETISDDLNPFQHCIRLDHWLSCQDQRLMDAANHLMQKIDCSGRPSLIQTNLNLLVLALSDLLQRKPHGYFISYSRTDEDWTRSVYLPVGISRKIVEVIDALQAAGYLECVRGNQYRFDEESEQWIHCSSRLRPTTKFIELVYKAFCLADMTVSLSPSKPLIIIKDSNGEPVDYQYDEKIASMGAIVRNYNSFMSDYDFTVLDAYYDERVNVKQNNLYRVFNNSSLSLGGRFYGGDIQSLPSSVRSRLLINGESTVELDYCANHLCFLYAREGISYAQEIGGDPYNLEGYERRLVKSAILYLLNVSGNLRSAWQALRQSYSGDPQSLDAIGDKLIQFKEGILEKIRVRHTVLDNFLNERRGGNLGLSLQYEDSCVAEKVITILVNKGIPVVPIHDSFIVRRSDKDFLFSAMVQAYHDLNKSLAIPDIKEK